MLFGRHIRNKKLDSNYQFNMYRPYPDSPKYVFELVDGEGVVYSLDECSTPTDTVTTKNTSSGIDYVTEATKAKEDIYRCVPDSVKSYFEGELGEWQAALLFAYKYL